MQVQVTPSMMRLLRAFFYVRVAIASDTFLGPEMFVPVFVRPHDCGDILVLELSLMH